jgi:iron complex outermembrane receptor protein
VYDNLRSLELSGGPGRIVEFNNLNAHTYGGEVSGKYDAFEWLRFNVGYSYLEEHLRTDPGHFDVFNGTIEGNDPKHQFFIRGSADLPHNIEVDSTLRFVSRLPSPVVPRYTELDERFGWNPIPKVELSIIGRNLLDRQHPEFGPAGPFREEVQRNIYGRMAVRF